MAGRCVICGAPLTGSVCSYCGTPAQNSRRTAEYSWNSESRAKSGYGAQESRFDQRTRRTEPREASVKTVASTRNKWVAFVLCLTLGWLGIHRFYVGKIGTGILYWATKGFYGVGVVVDLILILTDRFEDAQGLPLRSENEAERAGARS